MSWEPPRKDGGRPITGFIVEKKEAGSDKWVKACPGQISGNQATVKGLQTGKEYEFRVSAVNEVGVGDKGEPTEPIKIKPPPVPPHIGLDLMQKEVVVKAGEQLKIRVPFSGGNPPPTMTGTLNGLPVVAGEKAKFETTPENECLFVKDNCTRADGGKYLFQLKNEKGTDTAPIFVTVLDKPGPPTAPLRISDIKSDSCSLSWQPPNVCNLQCMYIDKFVFSSIH